MTHLLKGRKMRGADSYNEALFSTVKLDEFVPVTCLYRRYFNGLLAVERVGILIRSSPLMNPFMRHLTPYG